VLAFRYPIIFISNASCREVPNATSGARDDHAALFAAIPYDIAIVSRYRFEVVVLRAKTVETFGTIAIAQVVGGQGEMTMFTANRALAFWD